MMSGRPACTARSNTEPAKSEVRKCDESAKMQAFSCRAP